MLSFIGGISLIGIFTFYMTYSSVLDKSLKSMTESKEFQDNLLKQALSKIDALEVKLAKAELAIQTVTKNASRLADVPLSIDDNSLVAFSKSGEVVQIEFGVARVGVNKFKNVFESPPLLVMTPRDGSGLSRVSVAPEMITKSNFYIPIQSKSYIYSYIAIGKPLQPNLPTVKSAQPIR